MHQLTQSLKDGAMEILEVPFPALPAGGVLVRNHYSVISAGTEGKTVKDARLGYLAKARARQKEVKQVLNAVKTSGLRTTYNMVMNKLEAPSALGYSCAGEVIAVGPDVAGFAVGDRVACAGSGAVHAEVVAVPKNLCVKVPDGVDLRHAAFATIAAIALQGVRQAEVGLGGHCVVIGLGLVGLLTVQLLEAAGVQVTGIDLDPAQVARARDLGAALALAREAPGLEAAISDFTRGVGADAVIITAGTSSLDPIELAGRLCRKKGHVVVVGGVPTGFSREHYYRKELDLRMSCSYGPGRYDPTYEEHGIDYPIGYVRWTENRNMQAFLDLLATGKLDVSPLITHTFPLVQAPDAYRIILERSEPFAGMLIAYDTGRPLADRVDVSSRPVSPAKGRIGLIGAGSFAQNVLLPALKGQGDFMGVATARPNNARYVADKYGFEYCTGQAGEVLGDDRIDTIFVLTRHDLHGPCVLEALRQGKHVFVEKPLCLRPEEVDEIAAAYREREVHLMVGFNRRFAPQVQQIRDFLPAGVPKAITYRINAGIVPPDHWVHDPAVGGGRVLGEACHFLDLAMYLAGAPITTVAATAMADPHHLADTVVVNLGFANGSTAAVSYFSNGNKAVSKERLEVFAGGHVAVLDDFRVLTLYGDRGKKEKTAKQDKGHAREVAAFMRAIREGGPTPIAFEEILCTTRATFAVLEAIRTHEKVEV